MNAFTERLTSVPQRWLWLGCAGVSLALLLACLSGAVAVWAVQGWLLQGMPFGYVVHMCAGVNTGGVFQVGFNWQPPWMSSIMGPVWSWPRVGVACGYVPWLPVLPQRGGWVFPP